VNVNTTITPVPSSTFEVKTLLLNHFTRILKGHTFNARCALLPLTPPNNARVTHLPSDTKRFSKDCVSSFIDFILAPPLTPMKVMFQVLGHNQDSNSLRNLCISDGRAVRYQLILHVCDSFIDLCFCVPDKLARKIFGAPASDLINRHKSEVFFDLAHCKLLSLIRKEQISEGTVVSIMIKDRQFFVLIDCPKLSCTGD